MTERLSLSVAMIARNEADRIGPTLESVAWADEIVVLDSGSSDDTPSRARARGARVLETGWPGYAAQKRRAVEKAAGPWVLALDADEVVSPELAEEIRALLEAGPEHAGYEIPFLTRFLGRWLGRRGWHRERHLRLVRKDAVRVEGGRIHESFTVAGSVGRLEHPVLHHTYEDLGQHLEKMREYTELKARQKHERGQRASLAGAVGHGVAAFFSAWLLRGRILDGWAGLVWSLLSGQASLSAYVRLWELGREVAPEAADGENGSPPP